VSISINDTYAEHLAHRLAEVTGESLTLAITKALDERLLRIEGPRTPTEKLASARAIVRRVDALPVLDDRASDEILGYDEDGLLERDESRG
jgi:antitoxin VapB